MKIKAKIKYNKQWCKVTNINTENNTCDFILDNSKIKCYNYSLPKKDKDFIISVEPKEIEST